jgi:hypothetical protein
LEHKACPARVDDGDDDDDDDLGITLRPTQGGGKGKRSDLSSFYKNIYLVIFRVLTAASMKMAAVFWVVEQCSPVEVYRRFRDACCVHHDRDE